MDKIRKQNDAFAKAMEAEPVETVAVVPVSEKSPAKTTWVPPDTRREIFDGGRAIGHFEGLDFARRIITGVQLGKLALIKENKTYRLSGFQTWDAFCREVLGVNHDVIDEKLVMLKRFGAEFFDAAREVSLNRRTLRELKALPDDVMKDVVQGKTLVVEGEEIPLDEDHADEINSALAAVISKYKHQASEEESHSTLAAKENLKLKRELEKKDEAIRKLQENPVSDWVDGYVKKATEFCSEAVIRISQISQAARLIKDPEIREHALGYILSNLNRAVVELEESLTGEFNVPGATDEPGLGGN